jgi:hypothetical protein
MLGGMGSFNDVVLHRNGKIVDFRFEMSRISILALIRPAFSSDLKRLINSTQFPAHYGATNLINLARKSAPPSCLNRLFPAPGLNRLASFNKDDNVSF